MFSSSWLTFIWLFATTQVPMFWPRWTKCWFFVKGEAICLSTGNMSLSRVTSFRHCIHPQFLSIALNNNGGPHWLFVILAPGFVCLHWHLNMANHKTAVASISENSSDLCLFSHRWVRRCYASSGHKLDSSIRLPDEEAYYITAENASPLL